MCGVGGGYRVELGGGGGVGEVAATVGVYGGEGGVGEELAEDVSALFERCCQYLSWVSDVKEHSIQRARCFRQALQEPCLFPVAWTVNSTYFYIFQSSGAIVYICMRFCSWRKQQDGAHHGRSGERHRRHMTGPRRSFVYYGHREQLQLLIKFG